jgi:hypothetical protein
MMARISRMKSKNKIKHFERIVRARVSKEIKLRIKKDLDRILHGFSWETVEPTKREQALERRGKLTAAKFLQL